MIKIPVNIRVVKVLTDRRKQKIGRIGNIRNRDRYAESAQKFLVMLKRFHMVFHLKLRPCLRCGMVCLRDSLFFAPCIERRFVKIVPELECIRIFVLLMCFQTRIFVDESDGDQSGILRHGHAGIRIFCGENHFREPLNVFADRGMIPG